MRQKVEENFGTLGATTIALLFVVAYSFWGMTVLNNERASHAVAGQEQNLAIK